MRDCPKHGLRALSCDDCYDEEREAEVKRLRAEVTQWETAFQSQTQTCAAFLAQARQAEKDRDQLKDENAFLVQAVEMAAQDIAYFEKERDRMVKALQGIRRHLSGQEGLDYQGRILRADDLITEALK